MHSIVVKPINSEFIAVWVKLMLRSGHSLGDFDLQPLPSNTGRQDFTITNKDMLDSLTLDFTDFRMSKLSMEEYFQTNIIPAIRQKTNKFNLPKITNLIFTKVK